MNPAQQFSDAMRADGLNPPPDIEPGKFHRFPGEGKKNGNTAAWCKLFPDGLGGIYGDYSTGLNTDWQAKRERPFTPSEREAFKRQVAETRAQEEAEREAKYAEARQAAQEIWDAAGATSADENHLYLISKGVKAHGMRIYRGPLAINDMPCDGALIIPIRIGGEIQTLQFISDDGMKRFLPGGRKQGGYFGFGSPEEVDASSAICIAEGYATAATIREGMNLPVVAAFDAGNLEPVAKTIRAKYPHATIVICGDVDRSGAGQKAARTAAEAASGVVALPEFTIEELADENPPSDFNDLWDLRGPGALRRCIDAAIGADSRMQPLPAIDTTADETENAPEPDLSDCEPPSDTDAPPIDVYEQDAQRDKPAGAPMNWAKLAGLAPPSRQWIAEGWIGAGHATLLVGQGGIGKTLAAQQWASCIALGRTFIGETFRAARVLMWACEDDHDELWRRELPIAQWLNTDLDAFTENLIIQPRQGMENALAAQDGGRLLFTPALEELAQQAGDYKAEVVILDNVAQMFGGNENDRHMVTNFINRLSGALPGRAIVLLAHPARAIGSEFSGSGAWENAARTRLYLGNRLPDQKADSDEEPAEGVRYLSRRKANYSSKDYRRLQFREGVLIPDEIEAAAPGGLVAHLRDQNTERVVIDGMRKLAGIGTYGTDGATGPRYLPRLLLEHKLADGRSKAELASAMRRLLMAQRIVRGPVGVYQNRAQKEGLKVAE